MPVGGGLRREAGPRLVIVRVLEEEGVAPAQLAVLRCRRCLTGGTTRKTVICRHGCGDSARVAAGIRGEGQPRRRTRSPTEEWARLRGLEEAVWRGGGGGGGGPGGAWAGVAAMAEGVVGAPRGVIVERRIGARIVCGAIYIVVVSVVPKVARCFPPRAPAKDGGGEGCVGVTGGKT